VLVQLSGIEVRFEGSEANASCRLGGFSNGRFPFAIAYSFWPLMRSPTCSRLNMAIIAIRAITCAVRLF
jgi:hypothetical protein